jgi:serine/threonine-protein kinase
MFQASVVVSGIQGSRSVGLRVPGYELLEMIGRGGSAVVYRAQQRSVGREVAIKILRAKGAEGSAVLRRFEREARIVGQLRHPNTIRLYDVGCTEDGNLFLVTELLTGRSIADIMSDGPLAVPRVLSIGKQITGALADAHAAGVIHRDIKPANIFLERVGDDDVVKVLDFGIAREMSNPNVSRGDLILGSPAYMAPEQITSGSVDHRADIYALGTLLHELLSGRRMFAATTTREMLAMHLTQIAPPIWLDRTSIPVAHVELERLVFSMLEKSPDRRPQSMLEVRSRLQRIVSMLERVELMAPVDSPVTLDEDLSLAFATEAPTNAFRRALAFLAANRWARAGGLMLIAAVALAATATVIVSAQN